MADLMLDTGALADLLAAYFSSPDRDIPTLTPTPFLPDIVVRQIARIVRATQSGLGTDVVAASAFAFVELARKWDDIVYDRFDASQLAAFIAAPPAWFSIDPLDETQFAGFLSVPAMVDMPDGTSRQIEWADAVHAAAALSRDDCVLVTRDMRLRQLPQPVVL